MCYLKYWKTTHYSFENCMVVFSSLIIFVYKILLLFLVSMHLDKVWELLEWIMKSNERMQKEVNSFFSINWTFWNWIISKCLYIDSLTYFQNSIYNLQLITMNSCMIIQCALGYCFGNGVSCSILKKLCGKIKGKLQKLRTEKEI